MSTYKHSVALLGTEENLRAWCHGTTYDLEWSWGLIGSHECPSKQAQICAEGCEGDNFTHINRQCNH